MTRSNYAHRYMDGLRKGENGLYWLYRRLLYDMRYNEKDESRILLCLPQKKLILCLQSHESYQHAIWANPNGLSYHVQQRSNQGIEGTLSISTRLIWFITSSLLEEFPSFTGWK